MAVPTLPAYPISAVGGFCAFLSERIPIAFFALAFV
jgi:hypothetical protein